MKVIILLLLACGCGYKCSDGEVWREMSHDVWIKHTDFYGKPMECKGETDK